MKTNLFSMLIACAISGSLMAQITNNSFESWTGNEADGWVSTNGLTALNNPQSVFKSTDAHSGSLACEINAVHITNKIPGVFIPDYAGSIFIGEQVGLQSIWGFPYTLKPAKLEFWYKYHSGGLDSATAIVGLTKWNSANGKRDTIAYGFFFNSANDSIYTKATVILNYLSTSTPDTAIIGFSAVTLSSQQAGAKFTIDDLNFTGGNVGIKEIKDQLSFELYPNPSNGTAYLQFSKIEASIKINLFDMQGREIWTNEVFNVKEAKISPPVLTSGIYFLKINNGQSESIKKLWVE